MKTPDLALLFLLTVAAQSDAIIIKRCSLIAILKDRGMEGFAGTRIADWICLVNHSSHFNTAAFNVGPLANNYGIFLFSGRWWCQDARTPQATHNNCNLHCEKLRDDNITDDIQCAKTVAKGRHGLEAWRAWRNYCKGKDLSQYVAACEPEEATPQPPIPVLPPMIGQRPNTTLSAMDHPNTTFPANGVPRPTVAPNELPQSSIPSKPPPKPTLSPEEPPKSPLPANGLPKSTMAPKEPPKSPIPSKAPPKPTLSPEEPAKSPLPANGLPKSTMAPKEPPKSPIPSKAPPKPTLSPEEPPKSPLPANGFPKSTMAPKESAQFSLPAKALPKATSIPKEPSSPPAVPTNLTLPADGLLQPTLSIQEVSNQTVPSD